MRKLISLWMGGLLAFVALAIAGPAQLLLIANRASRFWFRCPGSHSI